MIRKNLPYWKLKREFRTLWTQLGFPFELLSMPVRRKLYDRNRHKSIIHSPGAGSLSENVAVLLIFQPDGVCNSAFETLDYLNDNGFSPIVVSNAKLSTSDLERLRENAFHVLERPNLGYDFGGYREGIMHLLDNNILPENLVLVNDSVWLPVRRNCDFLSQVKEQSADLFGIVFSENSDSPKNYHLQSYFYNFKNELIRDPVFRSFWENLFFSQNRTWVIKMCERKLTQNFIDRGYVVDWFCNQEDLEEALISLSKPDLKMVAKYQMKMDRKNSKALGEVIESGSNESYWRDSVKKLIKKGVFGEYILIAHPVVLFRHIKLPVLKKERQRVYRAQRKEIFNCGLDVLLTAAVEEEMVEDQILADKMAINDA